MTECPHTDPGKSKPDKFGHLCLSGDVCSTFLSSKGIWYLLRSDRLYVCRSGVGWTIRIFELENRWAETPHSAQPRQGQPVAVSYPLRCLGFRQDQRCACIRTLCAIKILSPMLQATIASHLPQASYFRKPLVFDYIRPLWPDACRQSLLCAAVLHFSSYCYGI